MTRLRARPKMAGIGGVFLWLRLQSRQRILSALESLSSIYGRCRCFAKEEEPGCEPRMGENF